MSKTIFRGLWFVFIVLAAGLACSLVSGISDQIDEVRSTAGSVATEVGQGRSFASTARALVTEVGESDLIGTAQAMATEAGESDFLETSQAILTDGAPGLVETGQAMFTQQGPELLATANAALTQAAAAFGQAPEDIPIVEGEKGNYFATPETVSYFTALPYTQVVQFYKTEMPNQGWQKVDTGWVESENAAIMYFEKADRSVSVTVSVNPGDNQTVVLVVITPK